MKKSIRRLVVAVAVVLGLGFGTTAFADAPHGEGTTSTDTQIGLRIVNNNHYSGTGTVTNGGDGDEIDNNTIPNGHKPTVTPNHGGQGAQGTNANGPAKKPAGAVASVVHSGTADLVAGRLPQTGESQVFLASVFGLFLLIAIVLLAVVRWQARLLREHR
ncbi:LPXTG cell wall anchor domain-containing protein [Levilactobacillus tujiorum]|uniref:LPXTG cell wall anchor domain-containing protein n=1 Tax=Levilactobacillus tujiorum TaxID=2912243 RepID=UPI0014566FEE|nr:LPXTG cell wall anchor domain-containing protein [Levilactobacillus tujiorum]NLR31979.1 LPXTG cell wall anchor domain-containing protein [Levilactobacillus tujiorum]